MMQLKRAVLSFEGNKFAVVVVPPHVLQMENKEELRNRLKGYFKEEVEIVFMAEDSSCNYDGDQRFVMFLKGKDYLEINDLPWAPLVL